MARFRGWCTDIRPRPRLQGREYSGRRRGRIQTGHVVASISSHLRQVAARWNRNVCGLHGKALVTDSNSRLPELLPAGLAGDRQPDEIRIASNAAGDRIGFKVSIEQNRLDV